MPYKDAATRRTYHRTYNRKYREDHPGFDREQCHIYYQEHKKAVMARKRRYQATNTLRSKASKAIRTAVLQGRLRKPRRCEECGTATVAQLLAGHHHNGYENPRDVIWLCPPCHGKRHRMAD